MSISSLKGNLGDIFFSDLQLMIPRAKIYRREILGTLKLIEQIINLNSGYLFFTVINHRQHRCAPLRHTRSDKPFSNSSSSCNFNSFNSTGAILYGTLEISAVLCTRSIENFTSLAEGLLGNSSKKTSKYSHTIRTSCNSNFLLSSPTNEAK